MGFSGSGQTEGNKKSRKSPLALILHEKEDCLYVQLYKRCLSLSCLSGLQASLKTAKRRDQKEKENCSFVLIKYETYIVRLCSATERNSRSDHKGQKIKDGEKTLFISKFWFLYFWGHHIWNERWKLIIQWGEQMRFYVFIIITIIYNIICWVLAVIYHPSNDDHARRTCWLCRRSRFTTEITMLCLWKVFFFLDLKHDWSLKSLLVPAFSKKNVL